MMKLIAICILMLVSNAVLGQLKKWELSFELSPTVSNITNRAWVNGNAGLEASYNAFLKGGYRINRRMVATFGIGYLVTDEFSRLPFGITGTSDFTEQLTSHHYYVGTIGLKFNFGTFFINPEIGIAFDRAHHVISDEYTLGDNFLDVNRSRFVIESGSLERKVTFPAMLSFGNEFDLGSVKLLLGAKAYYSLNTVRQFGNNNGKYYGFGVMTGMKF